MRHIKREAQMKHIHRHSYKMSRECEKRDKQEYIVERRWRVRVPVYAE